MHCTISFRKEPHLVNIPHEAIQVLVFGNALPRALEQRQVHCIEAQQSREETNVGQSEAMGTAEEALRGEVGVEAGQAGGEGGGGRGVGTLGGGEAAPKQAAKETRQVLNDSL